MAARCARRCRSGRGGGRVSRCVTWGTNTRCTGCGYGGGRRRGRRWSCTSRRGRGRAYSASFAWRDRSRGAAEARLELQKAAVAVFGAADRLEEGGRDRERERRLRRRGEGEGTPAACDFVSRLRRDRGRENGALRRGLLGGG